MHSDNGRTNMRINLVWVSGQVEVWILPHTVIVSVKCLNLHVILRQTDEMTTIVYHYYTVCCNTMIEYLLTAHSKSIPIYDIIML